MTSLETNTFDANIFVEKITHMLSQLHGVGVPQITLIETHISWVFLTGQLVYKIKKPVNLGFVDFSTLDRRHQFCREELRLNKRLAPDLYRDVVAITDDQGKLYINGNGAIIDYAVRLQQFDPGMQFDQLLENNQLTPEHIEAVATILANFHHKIATASSTAAPLQHETPDPHGNPDTLHHATEDNYQHCRALLTDPVDIENINRLSHWSNAEFRRIQAFLSTRQKTGFIRECHGDVHLGNIALYQHNVTVFDCIEFNADFRWIDVINEVSFLVMDLLSRKRQDYATLVLNTYLEITGDYEGLTSLRYYLVYRAMVRAKVEIIRASQKNIADAHPPVTDKTITPYHRYINLALQLCDAKQPILIIMHGLSGSGKSTVVKQLQTALFLVQIRSDVERKRLLRPNPATQSPSETDKGIYSPQASVQTYQRLHTLAERILQAGINVVVDAAFLRKADRQRFQHLAQTLKTPFVILHCHAEPNVLRQRIQARSTQGNSVSDATLEVLDNQLNNREPFEADEHSRVISVDTLAPVQGDALVRAILGTADTQ